MSRLRWTQLQTLDEMSTETYRTGSLCIEDDRGDVVMNEVPTPLEEVSPPPPPAEPPPLLKTSEETDAMMLSAVHPFWSRGTFGDQQDRV